MKKFAKKIKSVSISIKIIFSTSIIYSLSYKLALQNILEIFPFAFELGLIMFNLSIALTASCIFYFIVVHIREFNNKNKAYNIISNKIHRLLNNERKVTDALVEKFNRKEFEKDYSKDFFDKLFNDVKSEDVAPNLFIKTKNNNWIEYLFYYVSDSKDIIKEIYQFMPYVEIDLLIILDELENCKYFNFFALIEKIIFKFPNLSILSDFYYEYTKLTSKLEKYLIKLDKNYL
jgi:hypothetical protein